MRKKYQDGGDQDPSLNLPGMEYMPGIMDTAGSSPEEGQTKIPVRSVSIVDFLRDQGINSSFANRKELAKMHGIRNYTGKDYQNLQLLSALSGNSVQEILHAARNTGQRRGDNRVYNARNPLAAVTVSAPTQQRGPGANPVPSAPSDYSGASDQPYQDYSGAADQNATYTPPSDYSGASDIDNYVPPGTPSAGTPPSNYGETPGMFGGLKDWWHGVMNPMEGQASRPAQVNPHQDDTQKVSKSGIRNGVIHDPKSGKIYVVKGGKVTDTIPANMKNYEKYLDQFFPTGAQVVYINPQTGAYEDHGKQSFKPKRAVGATGSYDDGGSIYDIPGIGYNAFEEVPQFKAGGWIAAASRSIKRRGTAGKCTPISKPGCTGRAKALAKTFKKIARNRKKHNDGGSVGDGGYTPQAAYGYDAMGNWTTSNNLSNTAAGTLYGLIDQVTNYNSADDGLSVTTTTLPPGYKGPFGNWSTLDNQAGIAANTVYNAAGPSKIGQNYKPVGPKLMGPFLPEDESHVASQEQAYLNAGPQPGSDRKYGALTAEEWATQYHSDNPEDNPNFIGPKKPAWANYPAPEHTTTTTTLRPNHLSEILATGLMAADALIPQKKQHYEYLHPQDYQYYNQWPYGTGSEALMAKGGSLTPSKASQMLADGTAQGHPLTHKQRRYFQAVAHGMKPKALEGVNIIPDGNQYMPEDPYAPQMPYGGQTPQGNTLQVEDNQFRELSPSFGEFGGEYHEDGGTDVNYSGTPIEAEKGEAFSVADDGTGTVWGNMIVPGTKMKFKTMGKKLADIENKITKQAESAVRIMDYYPDITDHYGRLAANSAALKRKGAQMKADMLHKQTEHLTQVQRDMLSMADNYGIDAQAMSRGQFIPEQQEEQYPMGDDGYSIYADAGATADPNTASGSKAPVKMPPKMKAAVEAAAAKYGIPLNVAYRLFQQENPNFDPGAVSNVGAMGVGQFMEPTAKQYGLSKADLQNPDKIGDVIDASMHYLSDLKRQYGTIDAAVAAYNGGQKIIPYIRKRTGKQNVTAQDITRVLDEDQRNQPTEDKTRWRLQTNKYVKNIFNTGNLSDADLDKELNQYSVDFYGTKLPPPPPDIIPPEDKPKEEPQTTLPPAPGIQPTTTLPPWQFSDWKQPPFEPYKLKWEQYAPDIFAAAQNKQEYVPAQHYIPRLYDPYQVSFRDQINENNRNFNALQSTYSDNPAVAAALAAQTNAQNEQVFGNEFRTNQQISNDVVNKNVPLVNQAQLYNLGVNDQQYYRQALAKSNTKAENQRILNSITAKKLQNDYRNQELAAYRTMYNFRLADTNGDGYFDTQQYVGAPYQPLYTTPYTPVQSMATVGGTGDGTTEQRQTQQARYDRWGNPIGSVRGSETRQKRKSKKGASIQGFFNQKYGRK